MAALLHLDGLGAPITHDFENGWALFCSMLLLRDDFVGPVPVPPPSPGATVRICGESWGKVEAIVMAKPRISPDTASATGRAVELTEQPSWLTPAQAATRLGMPRAALERLRKGVPGNLPGAPVNSSSQPLLGPEVGPKPLRVRGSAGTPNGQEEHRQCVQNRPENLSTGLLAPLKATLKVQ